ncbi:hypothetical protein [Aeromonas veronii]
MVALRESDDLLSLAFGIKAVPILLLMTSVSLKTSALRVWQGAPGSAP